MQVRMLGVAVALVAIGAGLAACGSASGGSSGAQQKLAVTLTDAGCSPSHLSAKPGSVTFDVTNGGTGKVSELELKNQQGIILGEQENIVAGISGGFSLKLEPGRYVLNCPNGSTEDNGSLVVKGQPVAATGGASAALLSKATRGYQTYVVGETAKLLDGTRRFVAALHAGNLTQAKALFGPTRIHYEAIEPVAESFGNLDPRIDARVNDVATPSQWTGFHRIEQILWVKHTTLGTQAYADQLLADVTTLDRRVKTLTYQPAQLANGGVELLNEVANSKITGEEDRYSHTDLSDFEGNLTGARTAFALLEPALRSTGNAALAAKIVSRFAAVQQTLDHYRRSTPLGFALYGQLTKADRGRLASEVFALAESLSTVAAEVTS